MTLERHADRIPDRNETAILFVTEVAESFLLRNQAGVWRHNVSKVVGDAIGLL